MKSTTILLASLIFCICSIPAISQTTEESESETTIFAIFPFKNLYGEEQYEELGWEYADSLEAYLNRQEGAGTLFEVLPAVDVQDQMLAMNVDVKSPSYETDVWEIAEALGAHKIVWGTYYVKYNKAFIEARIIDLSINMADHENVGEKKGILYDEAIISVPEVGDKLLPGMTITY